jgi:hypothetical protein
MAGKKRPSLAVKADSAIKKDRTMGTQMIMQCNAPWITRGEFVKLQ